MRFTKQSLQSRLHIYRLEVKKEGHEWTGTPQRPGWPTWHLVACDLGDKCPTEARVLHQVPKHTHIQPRSQRPQRCRGKQEQLQTKLLLLANMMKGQITNNVCALQKGCCLPSTPHLSGENLPHSSCWQETHREVILGDVGQLSQVGAWWNHRRVQQRHQWGAQWKPKHISLWKVVGGPCSILWGIPIIMNLNFLPAL